MSQFFTYAAGAFVVGEAGTLLTYDPAFSLQPAPSIPDRAPAGMLPNGDFDGAAGWNQTGGWTFASNQLSASSNTGFCYAFASTYANPFVAGQDYYLVLYIRELRGGLRAVFNNGMVDHTFLRAGYFRLRFTATGGDTNFNLVGNPSGSDNFTGIIEWVQFYPVPD